MLLTERYKDKIAGVLSCFDRIILQGTLPGWCFAKGMTEFLYVHKIRIFDYPQFAKTLRDMIREHVESVVREQGVLIEFIRKIKAFRKEARIKEVLKQRGTQPGLVHIFSAMETCTSYKPWHDKATGKTFLTYDSGKCLHYYLYFIDKTFGLCYLRVPTWCPFRLQFYFNGHNWLASELAKRHIPFVLQDNGFLSIEDFQTAQKLSDSLRIEKLHRALDIFVQRYCPVALQYGIDYRWSIMQAEYATDLLFRRQSELSSLYEPLVRTAIYSVKPENIASFLGRKLNGNYQGDMGNNFDTRILGTRIKHRMGASSIKMYDKFGIILRIETVVNNVSEFKHLREVETRGGETVRKIAPMKKTMYSLYALAGLLKASNRRYLEFISTFDDPSKGVKQLKNISKSVKSENRTYKGFNFYCAEDQKLFEVLARGEFNINGLYNKSLRRHFPAKSSSAISRILKRLRVHGIIKRVAYTHKYYLTKLGKAVITAGLAIKEMFVVPELAVSRLQYH